MAILESLLRRLGYIKLSTYGFVLTPDNRVMPMLPSAPLPVQWQAEDTLAEPMPAMAIPGLPPTPPPAKFAPQPPPVPAPAATAQRPPTPQPTAKTEPTDEEEWEWRMAMARARANADAPAAPLTPLARPARGTNPPPIATPRPEQPAASATDTQKVPTTAPTPRLKRPTGPPPGIGRRLRSAIKTPTKQVGPAPRPAARPAPAERTHRDLRRVDKPVLRAVPKTPPALPDPDTVVTQAAPARAFIRRSAASTPLPSITKRMAANG